MKGLTIAIIGTGNVGASIAYALILKDLVPHIILVDIDNKRCNAELLDLSNALPFCETSQLTIGNYKDAAQADIIIMCAGKPQKSGESRTELLNANKKIAESIFNELKPIHKNTIILMVANPVDSLTAYAQQISGLPTKQVFGSGTLLDTQRLCGILSKKINVAEQSIDAYVVGEYGDSQVCAWSSAHVANIPLSHFTQIKNDDYKKISDKVKNQAYEIIEGKGATYYGIATCVASICESIIYDQKRVLTLSTFIPKFNVCFSMPVVLGKNGIETILYPSLNEFEKEQLKVSAEQLKKLQN